MENSHRLQDRVVSWRQYQELDSWKFGSSGQLHSRSAWLGAAKTHVLSRQGRLWFKGRGKIFFSAARGR